MAFASAMSDGCLETFNKIVSAHGIFLSNTFNRE